MINIWKRKSLKKQPPVMSSVAEDSMAGIAEDGAIKEGESDEEADPDDPKGGRRSSLLPKSLAVESKEGGGRGGGLLASMAAAKKGSVEAGVAGGGAGVTGDDGKHPGRLGGPRSLGSSKIWKKNKNSVVMMQ